MNALRRYHAGDQELGAEPTPEQYLTNMTAVFRECRRVLRDDGIAFINVGDSYNANTGAGFNGNANHPDAARETQIPDTGIPPLNLIGIPERLALALQADGWVWRSTIIWQKRSAMPESVAGTRWERHKINTHLTKSVSSGGLDNSKMEWAAMKKVPLATWADCPGSPTCAPNDGLILRRGSWRPTRSHEVILMLTKGGGYFADQEAVKETGAVASHTEKTNPIRAPGDDGRNGFNMNQYISGFRNPRDVIAFQQEPLKIPKGYIPPIDVQHFAAFPPSLPTWCIKVSTSEKGVCPVCGAQWARVVDNRPMVIKRSSRAEDSGIRIASSGTMESPAETQMLGWRATCSHGHLTPVPAMVMDPFSGAGTTLLAAERLGRNGIGIELNPKYIELAKARLTADAPMLAGIDPQ